MESFDGRLRDECLNAHWFLSLDDAKSKIEAWRRDYNERRPHTSLGWMTPAEFTSSMGINPTDEAGRLTLNPDTKLGDRQQRRGSNRNWMKVGGHVSSNRK